MKCLRGIYLLILPLCAVAAGAAEPQPFLLQPAGQEFTLLKNWTFGKQRADATVRSKAELDKDFAYRYIWENGKLDKFKTYWSYHRDYPEGDAQSLHVFGDNALTLKGRIPPGGGLRERGIESGLLRAKLPITPGMYIEMRAKLPGGVGVWPNFWLEQGIEHPDGKITLHSKAMSEIDIFEFFNWDDRPETRIITCNVHPWGGKEAHGNPHDVFTLLKDAGYERHLDLGFDCSKDFHVFALDWVEDKPIWLVDGKPIKQTVYKWVEPGAHIVVANSIGMNLPGVKQTQMVADEKRWDYVIDYIRVWNRKSGALNIPVSSPENLAKVTQVKAETKATEAPKNNAPFTIAATGKWQSPAIGTSTADVAKLKANPLLKVDVTVPPDAEDAGWFMMKLALNGPGITRTESAWLRDARPGKAGIEKLTLAWDTSEVIAKLPDNANWFKIELVTQGDHARTIEVTNLRAEPLAGGNAVPLKLETPAPVYKPGVDGPTLYPDPKNEAAWPGKGVIRAFDFMIGERQAIWKQREKNQGAVVFVGDSLIGGWKNLAQAFPNLKVANSGVGGDVSRGVRFRFQEDVLNLKPRAIVINVGFNDLSAHGDPAAAVENIAAMLDAAWAQNPALPIIVCNVPLREAPQAPLKPGAREEFNARLKKLAEGKEHLTLLDMEPAFTDANGKQRYEFFAADRVHMVAAGYEKWAQLLTPIFQKLQ